MRVTRCGILLAGTTHSKRGPSIGALALPSSGRARDQVVRRPFGTMEGRSAGLALTGSDVVLGGSVRTIKYTGEFAVAAYRRAALMPHCG
jgi:hypothetical protein